MITATELYEIDYIEEIENDPEYNNDDASYDLATIGREIDEILKAKDLGETQDLRKVLKLMANFLKDAEVLAA